MEEKKNCERKDCIYYSTRWNLNCMSRSKLCTQDEMCPVFELDNYKLI
jgi:hypothetical protein